MIRFGIAGIPLTSKGRTLVDSIIDSHFLGLNALEVQLLRVNVEEAPAIEYSGMYPKDVDDSIIVNILRPDENGNYQSVGIDTQIESEDILQELFWNMAKNYDEIVEGGEIAKELDVQLSLHAPYYMDLLSHEEISEKSFDHLKWSLTIGRTMGARRVVSHTGFYRGNKKDSLMSAQKIYSRITKEFSHEQGFPYVGVETAGKPELFGTTAELISLAKKIPGVEPILNFPHVHSLAGGSLTDIASFEAVITEYAKYAKGDLYTEFSGVEHKDGSEIKMTAIKHGDLKFETLSEYLQDYSGDMTIISMSPLLEHDAQYMDVIFLRAIAKRLQRKSALKAGA
jgi:deoxyribonuclease-4